MTDTAPRRFRRARAIPPRPSSAAILSIAALLLAVLGALLVCGVVALPDAADGASYWRWRMALGA